MSEISKYFQDEDSTTRFIGDTCKCYIPVRYSDKGLMIRHSDRVTTLGIMDMTINNFINCGLFISAVIDMQPTEVNEITLNDTPYFELVFYKDDLLIMDKNYIMDNKLPYIIWTEFIAFGRMPKFITYKNIHEMLGRVSEVTGVDLSTSKSVEQVLFAHLYRDKDKPFVKYRNTPMEKDPIFISLKNVAYGPDDTLSKLLGSYASASLNSALVNESDKPSPIELVLRA